MVLTALQKSARFKPSPVLVIGVLVVIYVLILVNWQYGHLRFTSPYWNCLTLALSLLLPVAACFHLRKLPKSIGRTAIAVVLIPVSVVSFWLCLLVLIVGTMYSMFHDLDPSYIFVRSVNVNGTPVRAYLTNDGAVTRNGIIIQQEIRLLPGLIWIMPLGSDYPAGDVAMTVLDSHHVRCAFAGYDNNLKPQTHVRVVKTFSLPWQR